MKTIAAGEAKLLEILDDVERGETFVVTRDGKPVARIVPDDVTRQEHTRLVFEQIDRFRKKMPPLTVEEILSAIREGRR